jgi:hypothetical protein
MADLASEDLLPTGGGDTAYRLLTSDGVEVLDGPVERQLLAAAPEGLGGPGRARLHHKRRGARTRRAQDGGQLEVRGRTSRSSPSSTTRGNGYFASATKPLAMTIPKRRGPV